MTSRGWPVKIGDDVAFEFRDTPEAPVRRVWCRVTRVYASQLSVAPCDGPAQRWRMDRDAVVALVPRHPS